MRFFQVIVFACFIWPGVVLATGLAQPQPGAASSTRGPVEEQQKLVRGEAEVKRLERDVHQQESDSQQASERLQRQDATIADLQRQLQALQSSQASGQH